MTYAVFMLWAILLGCPFGVLAAAMTQDTASLTEKIERDVILIPRPMIAFVFLLKMEFPVLIDHRNRPSHASFVVAARLRLRQVSARARHLLSIFDKVAAGAPRVLTLPNGSKVKQLVDVP